MKNADGTLETLGTGMDRFSAQCGELQRFVDRWCKLQEEVLYDSFFKQSQVWAPAGSAGSYPSVQSIPESIQQTSSGPSSDLYQSEQEATRASSSGDDCPELRSCAMQVTHRSPVSTSNGVDNNLGVRSVYVPQQPPRPTFYSEASVEETESKRRRRDRADRRTMLSYISGISQSGDDLLSNSVKWIVNSSVERVKGSTNIIQRMGTSGRTTTVRSVRAVTTVIQGGRRIEIESEPGRAAAMRRCLSSFVNNGRFESMIAIVIIFNAALMSVQANYDMQNPSSASNPDIHRIELVLCIIYAAELVLRLVVNGWDYFVDANWMWNWFDMFLVAISIHDQIMTAIAVENAGSMFNLSFFRMLRLLKMLKLLRVIRLMKFFKELRLILYAVLGGVQAMFWACVLIAIISYVAGILFVQASAQYLKETRQDGSPTSRELIREYWKDVGTAMLSLFVACTSGKDWTVIASPLRDVGSLWYGVFVAYIAFFDFVIMNTLTSLFVDTVMDRSAKDLEMVIQLELEKRAGYVSMLQTFFEAMDHNNTGVITCEDFESNIGHPTIQGFVATLEIDIMNAKKVFSLPVT